jgi:hypothetical protein
MDTTRYLGFHLGAVASGGSVMEGCGAIATSRAAHRFGLWVQVTGEQDGCSCRVLGRQSRWEVAVRRSRATRRP